MEIIDAQVHQPRTEKPLGTPGAETDHYGSLLHGGRDVSESDFAVQTLVSIELAREAMDCVGVDAALLNGPLEFMDAAIERYPGRFAACMSWDVRISDPDQRIREFREHAAHLAIRASFANPALEPMFAAAEKLGVPVFGGFRQASSVGPVAAAHPNLTLVVDHFGLSQPPVFPQKPEPWDELPITLALAKYSNVHVKFSGAPALSLTPYPHLDIWPHLHAVIDAFGPKRLMWASDFTRMRMSEGNTAVNGPRSAWGGLYSDAVNFLRDTTEVSQPDKKEIFGGTIRRVLNWPEVV
jgi:predicted TIM-barrel fold metal-dependent hydrolase